MSMTWCWLSRWPMVRAWRWPLGSSQLPEAPSRPLVNAYHYTEHPMLSPPFVFVPVYSYLRICFCLCIFVFVFVSLLLHNDQSMHLITARIPCYCLSSYLCTQRDASICWKSILTTHNTSRCNLPTPPRNKMHSASIASIGWNTRLMAVESHLRRHSKAIASVDRITICRNNTEEGRSDHRMMQQCINFLDSLHHSATSEHVSVQNLAW